MIVRPVRSSDLPALIDLARSTGTGLTTLPANEERLAHRVGWAEKTFTGEAGRGDADYLFVLEDDDGRVVGISAIAGAVGLREPWYNFRVGLTVSASQELKIYREIPTLFLANDLTGNSELMPKFPLYTCFLSEEARAVIGKVHTDTEPALAMLKSEGFSYQGYVDIFDAGPAVECETSKIRAVRDSQALVLAVGTPGDDATPYLIHNRKREDCRITAAPARLAAGTLVVDPLTAKRLQLNAGDQVRAVPLSAARESK